MKLLNKFLYPVILGISVLIILIYFLNYDSKNLGKSTDIGLYYSYVLFYVTLAAIVLGFVYTSVIDPKTLVRSAIGFGIIAVLALIGFGMSGNEVTELFKKFNITPFLSQVIGGSLIMSFILMILSLVAIIYAEISNALK